MQPAASPRFSVPAELCSPAFLKAQREGRIPQFGWYEPSYLSTSATRYTSTVDRSSCFFPPVVDVVVSENLDGVFAGCSDSYEASGEDSRETPAQHQKKRDARRAAMGLAWEKLTPIEDIWNGPPLSSKVPPATDYERLLLDDQQRD